MNTKNIILGMVAGILMLGSFVGPTLAKGATVPGPWDASGSYVVNVEYLGTNYPETLILTQSGTAITGTSLDTIPAGSFFTVTGGSVIGNVINIFADNGSPNYHVHMEGIIATDGTMRGNWHDEEPGTREGTWATTSGSAMRFEGNHGQYVRFQENKQEAAQSRIGMPVQSKGHNK